MFSDGEWIGQIWQAEHTAGVEHYRTETETEGYRQGDAPGETEGMLQQLF